MTRDWKVFTEPQTGQRRGEKLLKTQPQISQEALDGADRDAVLEMEKSGGYALVFMRIHQEIVRRQAELEQSADIESTQYIRGCLYGLRVALRIPEILKGEIQP